MLFICNQGCITNYTNDLLLLMISNLLFFLKIYSWRRMKFLEGWSDWHTGLSTGRSFGFCCKTHSASTSNVYCTQGFYIETSSCSFFSSILQRFFPLNIVDIYRAKRFTYCNHLLFFWIVQLSIPSCNISLIVMIF